MQFQEQTSGISPAERTFSQETLIAQKDNKEGQITTIEAAFTAELDKLPSSEKKKALEQKIHSLADRAKQALRIVGGAATVALALNSPAFAEADSTNEAATPTKTSSLLEGTKLERKIAMVQDKFGNAKNAQDVVDATLVLAKTAIDSKVDDVTSNINTITDTKAPVTEQVIATAHFTKYIPGNLGKLSEMLLTGDQIKKEIKEAQGDKEGESSLPTSIAKKVGGFILDAHTFGLGTTAVEILTKHFPNQGLPPLDTRY